MGLNVHRQSDRQQIHRGLIYKCFLSRLQYKIEKLVKPVMSVFFGFVTCVTECIIYE